MRLFVAIHLPEEWKSLLAEPQESIGWLGKGVRWVDPKGMHLTLKFLGDVEPRQVDDICESLRSAAAEYTQFKMRIAGTGVFPKAQRPRVFWAGLTAPDELSLLQKAVELEMEKIGFPPEDRGFTPHLTLARIKDPIGKKRITDAFLQFKIRSEQHLVTEFSLVRSHLSSQGARYENLHSFQLAIPAGKK